MDSHGLEKTKSGQVTGREEKRAKSKEEDKLAKIEEEKSSLMINIPAEASNTTNMDLLNIDRKVQQM